jgi:uncharacterized protein (TIGR02594 family)
MTDQTPAWLSVMRTLTGTKEIAGPEANPVITGMADEIARHYPDMKWYCDLPSWDSDETAWCGMAAAYCMAQAGQRPPFQQKPADDTERWGWARSWADDAGFVPISSPRPGCVVVLERSGGGHVTFYESTSGSNYNCRGGNQSNSVNVSSFPKSSVIALMWPKDAPVPPVPPAERPMLQKGSKGPEVASVQQTLGLPPAACDGDFGPVTDGAVKGYQAAAGLEADGVVGPNTWAALDALDARKAAGDDGLKPELIKQICELAEDSAIAGYQWRDRGRAPVGYTQGVALCFAHAMTLLEAGDDTAWRMARAETGDPNKDALTWYRAKFQSFGMDNSQDGIDTLRHLFALMLGLGMRESSGRYCEGRDMSASNVQSDTAEAGMFQTSWNIRSCDPHIPPLLSLYWDNPNGFLPAFQNGVAPDSNDLGNFGSGGGAQYQFLSKFAPAFHAFVTALGMRSLRQHWGPINRNEVELKPEADDMLWQVQELVASGVTPAPPEPEPEPPPEVPTITISINPPGSAQVVIIGSATS